MIHWIILIMATIIDILAMIWWFKGGVSDRLVDKVHEMTNSFMLVWIICTIPPVALNWIIILGIPYLGRLLF